MLTQVVSGIVQIQQNQEVRNYLVEHFRFLGFLHHLTNSVIQVSKSLLQS